MASGIEATASVPCSLFIAIHFCLGVSSLVSGVLKSGSCDVTLEAVDISWSHSGDFAGMALGRTYYIGKLAGRSKCLVRLSDGSSHILG